MNIGLRSLSRIFRRLYEPVLSHTITVDGYSARSNGTNANPIQSGRTSGYLHYFNFNEGKSNNQTSGFPYPSSFIRALCVRGPGRKAQIEATGRITGNAELAGTQELWGYLKR